MHPFRGDRRNPLFGGSFNNTFEQIRGRPTDHRSVEMYDYPKNQEKPSFNSYPEGHDTVLLSALQNYGSGSDGGWERQAGGGPVRMTCGELRERHVGRSVELVGRVQQHRQGRFVQLRDGHGSTQLVVPEHVC